MSFQNNPLGQFSTSTALSGRNFSGTGEQTRQQRGLALLPLLQGYFQSESEGSDFHPIVQNLQSQIREGGRSLGEAIAHLSAEDRGVLQSRVGSDTLNALAGLGQESDNGIFWGDLVSFAQEQKRSGQPVQAMRAQQIFAYVAEGAEGVDPQARNLAQTELDALQGRGNLGLRLENSAGNLLHQATDWKMIAPMVLASPVYHLGRVGALRFLGSRATESLLTRGLGANILASGSAFLGETTFFSLSSRGLTHYFEGPVPWDLGSVGHDWIGAALTLGLLKSTGWAFRRGTMVAGGISETNPAQWTRAQRWSLAGSGQVGGYLGLVGAHYTEERLGFRPPTPGSSIWLDALGAHIALQVGAGMGRRMLGQGFAAWEHSVAQEAGTLYQASNLNLGQRGGLTPMEYVRGRMQGIMDVLRGGGTGFPPGMAPAYAGEAGAFMAVGSPEGREASPIPDNVVAMVGKGRERGRPSIVSSARNSSRPPRSIRGKYVLIGNRGEPAVRAVREAKELGATPIVFVSDADRESLHASLDGVITIPLKGNTSNETYNNIEARMGGLRALLEARKIKPRDIIAWEGWGFKSEDHELFARYEAEGIQIAGAPSESHHLMGDKVSARRVAMEAGARVVPGSEEITDVEAGLAFAREIGFPVIIKGKDTGGGKGIREVHEESQFRALFEDARREALSTSGSDAVFIEKFIPSMRHLEVQVVADGKGNFVTAGLRECSLQRAKQKVVEEDVTTSLDPKIRDQAFDIAGRLMGSKDLKTYKGPGTIELIWDVSDDTIYFMEMNTRLQVEHTVTEMVTQKNLLKAQLQLGAGQPLPFTEVESRGHAIEVRITSEDPYNGFKPSTGRILHYREPTPPKTGRKRLRVDSGVEAGREISQYYDSMIAKLIVWGETRGDAVEALQQALSEFEILGVKTNIPFLKALVGTPEFREQSWGDTKFITDVFLESPAGQPNYKDYQEALVTAAIQTYLGRKEVLIKSQAYTRGEGLDPKVELEFEGTKYETTVYERAPGQFLVRLGDSSVEVGVSRKDYVYTLDLDGVKRRSLIRAETGSREVLLDNVAYEIKVLGEGDLGPEYVLSPLPGKVIKLYVKPGDQVEVGQPVVRVEAMKMENDILAEVSGTVSEVFVQENANVGVREKLVFFETAAEASEGSETVETESVPPSFSISPTLYSRISDRSKPNYDSRRALMADTSALFEGYDAPTDLIASLLPRIKPSGVAESRAAEKGLGRLSQAVGFPSARAHFHEDLTNWIRGLVDRFVTVETVFLPVNRGKLLQYLQSGEIPEGSYGETLQKALSYHEGVSRDQAFFLLNKSHECRTEKAKLLSIILPWIPELKMAGLEASLDQLRGLYVTGVPRSFQTQVAESRRLLHQGLAGERNGLNLEDSLEPLFKRRGQRREEGYAEFLRKPGVELHFLLDQARHGKNITRRHVASNLIQRYLYGRRYRATYSKNVRPGYRTDMEPLPGMAGEPIHLFTGRVEKVGDPDLVIHKIEQGLETLPSSKDSSAGSRVVELIFQNTPDAEALSQLEEAIAERFRGADLSRVTLILPKSDGIGFHTYAPEEPGGPFREQTLLGNIHPVAARDLQLERWTLNFQVERRDMGLYDHVHAYRAVERNPANQRMVDRRHFVIGEHRGALSYERFDGERVRNRLIGDYRALRNDPNYRLDEDSQIAWSWLPYALQETGVLGAGFDPFSIGVLRASPREMIERFDLTEDKLSQVAEFYHNKVKIVPEAEKTAYDTALVMLKLQETVKRPLPANVDLFIHEPVEMTDAEIKLLAFRLTPGFMGQSIEKTTVHFCRREDGRVRHYIAEIKIPGQTRFEVTFKPALTNPPPHVPRSEIEHRRISQQSKGKLYVYDRVNLFHDVVKDFYPKGNVPPEAVRVQELILNEAGELVPTDRPHGQNDITKVAFLVNFKMPQDVEADHTIERQFIVIADDYAIRDEDYNSMAGSQGRREGDLYRAVSEYAVEHGIPKLYLAESSGARIGFADEVKPFVHMDPSDKSIYVLPEDLDAVVGKTEQPLRNLIRVGDQQEVIVDEAGSRVSVVGILKGLGGEYAEFAENLEAKREGIADYEEFLEKVRRGEAELESIPESQRGELEQTQMVLTDIDHGYVLSAVKGLGGEWDSLEAVASALGEPYQLQHRQPITAIIGEGEINTESLNASGMAGGSESRARSRHRAHLPTATITFGTTIGIATYLARLSEFVIMVKNSFLGLTGFRAINDVLGTKYTDQLEVAGPEIMRENGVAYKVVENERDALRAYMQWLSYQPVRQGEAAPHLEFNDPVDRDISEEVTALIQGAGQSYSTRALDGLIYDRGSVWYIQDDGYYGRYANTGFATLGGTPVGIISMEMSPKLRDGEKAVFPPPGGLDPDTSNKIAQHIRNVNRMGLPLIFNASITGFLPRHTDHLEGVVPAGARILDSLEEFNQPAIIWTPPQGNLYGGAWVVIDKNINPRVVMAADQSAKMGILGSTAANELPLVTRYHKGPEDIALTKAMLDAQNSPIRAHAVGSIHHLIENSGETRQRLYQILTEKMAEVRQQQETEAARLQLNNQLLGALTLMGVQHHVEGDQITIMTEIGSFTTDMERVRAGMQQHFQGSVLDVIRAMLQPEFEPNGD